MKKLELLAPAGDLEKLIVAITFGADAVYMGGGLGLRSRAQMSLDDMAEGIRFAHMHGRRAYVCANVFAHNADFVEMAEYFHTLEKIGTDALIISDPGVFAVARDLLPQMEIHISTQANITNYKSAQFWHNLGASRLILARELSLQEIREIYDNTPGGAKLEAFAHGAMCISYSGRCLLSNYLTDRDGNKGECAHPCRWNYHLLEETRPNEPMEIQQDERGSYILNSRDLCMVGHIPEMAAAGLAAIKIEGRMKTPYYVGAVTKAYRQAIDDFYENIDTYNANRQAYFEELTKVSHRHYTTGFYFGKPNADAQVYESSSYIRKYDFVGIVQEYDEISGLAVVEQRNKFSVGDEVDFVTAAGDNFSQQICEIYNLEGEAVSAAPHAQEVLRVRVSRPVAKFDIMRKKR